MWTKIVLQQHVRLLSQERDVRFEVQAVPSMVYEKDQKRRYRQINSWRPFSYSSKFIQDQQVISFWRKRALNSGKLPSGGLPRKSQ